MPKARGLGRGLSALIPERMPEEHRAASSLADEVALELIDANPWQPRRQFRETSLRELADSIGVHGVIQPVVLRSLGDRYQLVAGERRVRAARMAGLTSIPALVRAISDREAMELALVENLQRSDLNPIEESQAYQRLMDEFEWTQEEIGARVGKSRSHVANYLRLLQLEADIQQHIGDQTLTVAHGKVLLSVAGELRHLLAERASAEGWTVKQLEEAVKRGEVPRAPHQRTEDVHMKTVEAQLRRRFGTRVTLRGDSHKGRIEIPYRSLDELERLITLLEEERDGAGGFVV